MLSCIKPLGKLRTLEINFVFPSDQVTKKVGEMASPCFLSGFRAHFFRNKQATLGTKRCMSE